MSATEADPVESCIWQRPGRLQSRASVVAPWIRGAPQSGFACDMLRISLRTSSGTGGRPARCRRIHVQNMRTPWRCQAMTVSGLTMMSAACHLSQTLESHTHSNRDRAAVPLVPPGCRDPGRHRPGSGAGRSPDAAMPEVSDLAAVPAPPPAAVIEELRDLAAVPVPVPVAVIPDVIALAAVYPRPLVSP